ncbi:Mitochondrial 18 kDa protein [Aphelenchoides besseyi]|nr:Mitochondrial 18 kDa protein [Aphelenchoides besseyi]
MSSDQLSCGKRFVYEIERRWGNSDLYRETPIRFLGYANEVGEAFRALIPLSVVRSTYVVAVGYCLADAMDKSHSAYKKLYVTREERQKQVALTLLDTLVWQGFASVALPGLTINRLCAASTMILSRVTQMAPAPIKLWTTATGLIAIPFIIKPIDSLVELGMDETLRKFYDLHQIKTPPVPD